MSFFPVPDQKQTKTKGNFRKRFKGRVEKLAEDGKMRRLAQLGYAARGLLYFLFGLTMALATVNFQDRPRGIESSLNVLLERPFGRIAVGLVAVGLFGYVIRRFIQVWAPPDVGEPPVKIVRFGRRFSYACSAIWNIGITATALFLALGLTVAEYDWSVLRGLLPGWLVFLIGAGFFGYAIFEFYMAITRRFTVDLRFEGKHKRLENFTLVCGIIGYTGRGIAYFLVGVFVMYAGWLIQGARVSNLGNILSAIEAFPSSNGIFLVIAAGLIAYGVYLILAAWYLRVVATW